MSTDVPDQCEDSPPTRSPNQETTTSSSSMVAEIPVQSSTPSSLLDSLKLPQFVDKTTIQELLIHFHGLLIQTGLPNVADVLKYELESKGFIPQRYSFDGQPRPQTLDEFSNQFKSCGTDLLQILSRLNEQTNASIPPSISNLNIRLFSGPKNSLLRQPFSSKRKFTLSSRLSVPHIKMLQKCRNIDVLTAREFGIPIPTRLLQSKQAVTNINDHGKFQGHSLPVFCVTFDKTGRYVFTGGDDKLIKVWDTIYGRLRYTFRGHTAQISDLSINMENNCIASGSNDKTVRVWNAGSGQPLMVFKKHTTLVNVVQFTEFIDDDVRYLVSTGNDCAVIFYRYFASTLTFDPEPIRFEEREAPGARGLVVNCSSGGNFVVMGDSANMIHIYKVTKENVERIWECRAHDERVDSIVFANSHLRFASGSKDGLVKVWEFSSGEWVSTELRVNDQLQLQGAASQQTNRRANSYKVTMLGWSGDDSKVISTGSDCLIRVWDWKTGQMLRKMEAHSYEAFVIKAHPVHHDLVFTAGHDGLLILWDITNGQIMWKHKNQLDLHSPAVAIFDMTISPQGDRYAYVDINGMLTLLGLGENRLASSSVQQQFFSDDYDDMFFDANGFVRDVDEIPAHLALPALLVNVDLHPYGPEIQQHVPGRDFSDPTRVQNPWSDRKIIPQISLKESFLDRMAKSASELEEYEAGKPMDENEIKMRRQAEEERRRQAHLDKLEKQRNRRNNNRREREELLQQMITRPQYVIDDTFTDNDSTYSGGSGRSSPVGASDLSSNHDGVEEDFDSDYEEGGVERSTVFRNRSALTVTGRRKKTNTSRRNAEIADSQALSEDQPSTSQSTQQTTRYGRRSKPPNRMENEFEENTLTRPRRRTVQIKEEPSTSGHNTRSRRRILSSESPQPESSNHDNNMEHEAESYPQTTRRTKGKRVQRRISSNSGTPDLEALDNEIEQGMSPVSSPEGSLSQLWEQEEVFEEEDDEDVKSTNKSRRSSRRRTSKQYKDLSASRSPPSNHSDFGFDPNSDFEEDVKPRNLNSVKVLRSGRQSKPPIFLAEEMDSQSKRPRHPKIPSPQRRSARQSTHRYSFNEHSSVSPPPLPSNGYTDHKRKSRSSRRRTEEKHYYESDDGNMSQVAGPSYELQEPQRSHTRAKKSRSIEFSSAKFYPDWMTTSERRRFPYIPQLGDKVMYFVQGHRNYIKLSNVNVSHVYQKDIDMFGAEECFVIIDLKYELSKDGFVVQSVELAHLNSNGKPDGKRFKFRFHDQKDCPDFLILKQHYDKSRAYEFKPGDRVDMVLAESIYTGIIKSHQPFDPSYPLSEWNAMNVEWEDGVEQCSIWDLQPSNAPNSITKRHVTDDDIDDLGKYDPEVKDWPALNSEENPMAARNRHMERCLKIITELAEIPEVEPFMEMVNLKKYPSYTEVVKRPVYLELIIDRIRSNYYRRLISLKFDIQLIAQNTHRFNLTGTPINFQSEALITTIFNMLDDYTISSAQAHFQHIYADGTNSQSRYNEKLIKNDFFDLSSHEEHSSNPTTSSNSATNHTDSWKSQCKIMIDDLIKNHLANQSASLRERLTELCGEMQDKSEFESPSTFKDALKEVLANEGEDMSKKERKYIELTRLMNDLDKQFDPIISQYQRAQQVRKTTYRQSTKEDTYNLRRPAKRILRSQTTQQNSDQPSTSKRSRYH